MVRPLPSPLFPATLTIPAVLATAYGRTSVFRLILIEIRDLQKRLDRLMQDLILLGIANRHSTYISIESSSDGAEECDWAAILSRMYMRWGQSRSHRGVYATISSCSSIIRQLILPK